MIDENNQIDLKLSEFQQIQFHIDQSTLGKGNSFAEFDWISVCLKCLGDLLNILVSRESEIQGGGDKPGEPTIVLVDIDNVIVIVSNHIKNAVSKLIISDRLTAVIDYLVLCLQILNCSISCFSLLKKNLSKSSTDLLYQTCYVILNHYLTSIQKTDFLFIKLTPNESLQTEKSLGYLPPHIRKIKEKEILQENQKNWVIHKEKLYFHLIKFIRSLFQTNPDTMLSNLSLFLSESFKVEGNLDKAVSIIHRTVVSLSKSDQTNPHSPKKFNSGNPSTNDDPFCQLLTENTKFQSFILSCLLQNYFNEDILVEAMNLLTDIFATSVSVKKWLLSSTSHPFSSVASSAIIKPSSTRITASSNSVGMKLRKHLIKILQICIVKISPDFLKGTVPSSSSLSIKQYQSFLQFFSKMVQFLSTPSTAGGSTGLSTATVLGLFSSYPSSSKSSAQNDDYQFNEIEKYSGYLLEIIFLNCLQISDPNLNSLITTSSKSSSKKSANLPTGANSEPVQQYFNNLSMKSMESLHWFMSFIKLYSNNNYCYHFPFISRTLSQQFSMNVLPNPLQQILSSSKQSSSPLNWIEQILSLTEDSSIPDAQNSSADRIQIFLLFVVLTILTANQKTKCSNYYFSFHSFLLKNYFNLFLFSSDDITSSASSSSNNFHFLNYLASYYYFYSQAANTTSKGGTIADGFGELFLDLIQSIISYEISSKERLLTRPEESVLLYLKLNNANTQPFNLVSLIEILLNEELNNVNHSIRMISCQTICSFRGFQWKFLEDHAKGCQKRLYTQLTLLTKDQIGTVRAAVFRSIGEILSSYYLIFENLEAENHFALLDCCMKGCTDSKLAVRIQSTFALNKYLIFYAKFITSSGKQMEIYRLYQSLFEDSDKLLTTAIFGIGYLITFFFDIGSTVEKQSFTLVDQLIPLFISNILPNLLVQPSAAGSIFVEADKAMNFTLNGNCEDDSFSQLIKKEISLQKLLQKHSNKFICANSQTMTYITWYLLLSSRQKIEEERENHTKLWAMVFLNAHIHLYFFTTGFLQLQIISAKSLSLFLSFGQFYNGYNGQISLNFGLLTYPALQGLLTVLSNHSYLVLPSSTTILNPAHNLNSTERAAGVKVLQKRNSSDLNSENHIQENQDNPSAINVLMRRKEIFKKLILQILYLLCCALSSNTHGTFTSEEYGDKFFQLFSNHLQTLVLFLENISIFVASKNDIHQNNDRTNEQSLFEEDAEEVDWNYLFTEEFPLISTKAFRIEDIAVQVRFHHSRTLQIFMIL
jgi:hypothetical protein